MKNDENSVGIWHYQQQKHFDAAIGYFELEMYEESDAELDQIDPSIPIQSLITLLALKIRIYYELKNWNSLQIIARRLVALDPAEPKWKFADSFATARVESIQAAKEILERANVIHPRQPIILYNLAVAELHLNNVEAFRRYFEQAFEIDSDFRSFVKAEDVSFEGFVAGLAEGRIRGAFNS
jgi:tetratricopeptide (TPR) repeat protein